MDEGGGGGEGAVRRMSGLITCLRHHNMFKETQHASLFMCFLISQQHQMEPFWFDANLFNLLEGLCRFGFNLMMTGSFLSNSESH